MDIPRTPKRRRNKGERTRKGDNPRRQFKYKHVFPGRIAKRKDRNVLKSSHGKFKSVAELEAHRKSVSK